MAQETLRGQVSEYRIYEPIASGGFASVYYGRDPATNVPVAVKRLHPHLQAEPGIIERFEQEAATVRGLTDAHIVRLLDQGRDLQGVPFIVMEWVEGLTVADWLKRQGRYSSAGAADVGCQVLEGLDAAWARRIVHRDIKPANLMVTPGGRLKIMDFGVAKDVELATLAGSSGLIGTPAYMAPEQLRGEPLDCRADLYSLGVTLFMMLAGRPPFEGPSFADYFRQHLEQPPPRLEELSDDVHPGVASVLRTALAKAPEDRFRNPADMLAALRPFASAPSTVDAPPDMGATIVAPLPFVATQPIAPRPQPVAPPPQPIAPPPQAVAPPPQPVAPPPQAVGVPPARTTRSRVWLVVSFAALLLVVLGGVVFVTQQTPSEATPTPQAAALLPVPSASLQLSAPSAAPSAAVAAPTWQIIGADSALFNEPVGVAFDTQGGVYVSNNGSHTVDKLDASGNLAARWGGAGAGQPRFHHPGGVAADDTGAIYVADTGNDRVVHLSSAGAVLGQVGGHGQSPGQFDGPTSVAVDASDNLYVADANNHRIQKLAPDGKVLATWGTFGTGPTNFNFPYGVALDARGNVYVADRNNNRVVKLSPQGAPLAAWPTASNTQTPLTNPSAVAVDAAGNVYVGGWANDRVQRIQKLSPAGAQTATWTIDAGNPAQLSLPYQLAFDSGGNIHVPEVAGDRLGEFTPVGTEVGALGTTRNELGEFRRPNNVGIDSHDRVYVTDWGNERIQSFASTPTQDQSQAATQWGRFTDLQGVAVDPQGNIFMTEHTDCRVRKIAASGDTLGLWGSCGAGQGQFHDPEAIAVDSSGNAYVADRGNDRIVELSPSGTVIKAYGTHGAGDGQLDQPTGVTVDAQGNVFVADRDNHRIVKLSPTWQILAVWGNQNNPSLQLSAPEGVAVDPRGNVFVADWGSSRILELSSSGELVAQLGSPGTGPGQFDAPEGLNVDGQGRLFVADTGNNRVQELAAGH